jgi:hypothetical protein
LVLSEDKGQRDLAEVVGVISMINILYLIGSICFLFSATKVTIVYLVLVRRLGYDVIKPFGFFMSWTRYTDYEKQSIVLWTLLAFSSVGFVGLVFLLRN